MLTGTCPAGEEEEKKREKKPTTTTFRLSFSPVVYFCVLHQLDPPSLSLSLPLGIFVYYDLSQPVYFCHFRCSLSPMVYFGVLHRPVHFCPCQLFVCLFVCFLLLSVLIYQPIFFLFRFFRGGVGAGGVGSTRFSLGLRWCIFVYDTFINSVFPAVYCIKRSTLVVFFSQSYGVFY